MTNLDVGLSTGTLDLNEMFGRTAQGEGPSLGRLCVFVRLARCNLDCGEGAGASWKCDTPYSWKWDGRFDTRTGPTFDPKAEIHTTPIEDVATWVESKDVGLCVVSGGEPLAQRAAVAALARRLAPIEVEVETNGTISPGPAADPVTAFNVSPKLANSGVALDKRFIPRALQALLDTGKARFKFVCATEADLDEVADFTEGVLAIPNEQVWIMPAGISADEIDGHLRTLAQPTIDRGWNLTTRLHVSVWGDKRGV